MVMAILVGISVILGLGPVVLKAIDKAEEHRARQCLTLKDDQGIQHTVCPPTPTDNNK